MKMQKQFRIGHVASLLGVQRFVIRFWEKEFNLTANRSTGGQRFYKQKDVDRFKMIQELLYEKKFTIAGAKEVLLQQKEFSTKIMKSSEMLQAERTFVFDEQILNQIIDLHKQLLKFRQLL